MRFFDCNCMIGSWHQKKLAFATAHGLLEQMDRYRIDKALVFHSRAWLSDPVEGNRALVRETALHDRLRPVLALTPLLDMEFGGENALAGFVRDHGIAAIRLFPKSQGFSLYPFNVGGIFAFARRMGLPVMIDHQQLDCRYDQLYQLLRLYPDVQVVQVEPNYRWFRVIYSLMEQCPNLYVDMSVFKGCGAVEDFVSRFGSRRLLFATRMPFLEGSLNVGRLIYSDISGTDKENIAFGNWERLFGRGGGGFE